LTPRSALHRRPSHPSPRLLLLLAARAALLERAAGARAPEAPSPFLGLREDSEKINGLFAKRSLLARSRPSMCPNRRSGLPSDVDALPCLGIGQESQVKDIQISQNINAASKHNIVARHGSIRAVPMVETIHKVQEIHLSKKSSLETIPPNAGVFA
jgi:hypothetical protein